MIIPSGTVTLAGSIIGILLLKYVYARLSVYRVIDSLRSGLIARSETTTSYRLTIR